MSKSLGNSPDPLELIDKYGADGLRFGLMRIAPSGQDIRFDERQIEEGRNFATKLWNVARFRQMHGASEATPRIDIQSLSIYAVEVLARLNETIDAIESEYREYHFNMIAQHLYNFVWSDYCDWFVEAAKTDIFSGDEVKKKSALVVMDVVLSATLRLLHPFMTCGRYAAIGLRYPKNSRFLMRCATSGGTICSHRLSPDCNFASTSGG